jgi:hypothetical protein
MTICFSFQTPNFIVAGSDCLVGNIKGEQLFLKKFIISTKRKFVILFSGNFILSDYSKPDPRVLLIEEINNIVGKHDLLFEAAKKVLLYVTNTYSPTDYVDLQMQFCGFDRDIPRIYLVSTKENLSKNLQSCLTGAQGATEYARTIEGQRQICYLKSVVPPEEGILLRKVREFMDGAVNYENQKSIENNEKPKTGGGINILTLYPESFVWHAPRTDPVGDRYKIFGGR